MRGSLVSVLLYVNEKKRERDGERERKREREREREKEKERKRKGELQSFIYPFPRVPTLNLNSLVVDGDETGFFLPPSPLSPPILK